MSRRKKIAAVVGAVVAMAGGVVAGAQVAGQSSVTVTTPDRVVTIPGETYTFTVPTVTETITVTAPPPTTTGPEQPPAQPLVEAPTPPQPYALPAGAKLCATSACLLAELAKPAHDIVLADGTYTNGAAVSMGANRIYAQHLGAAILNFGLHSNAPGWRIQGLRINVTLPARTLNGSMGAITTWSGGRGGTILDSYFDGGFGVLWGGLFYANDGMVIERVDARNYQDGAFYLFDNSTVAYGGNVQRVKHVSDLELSGFAWPSPGASNTYEGGIFFGQPVTDGVQRIRVRDVGRKCIEMFGNAWDTTFSDLDLDPSGAHAGTAQLAIYLEHYSLGLSFEDFIAKAGRGFNAEWDNGQAGNAAMRDRPATIRRGIFDATGRSSPFAGGSVGIYLDQGNPGVTVEDVTFIGQTRAAINVYRPTSPTTTTRVLYVNVAREFSSSHWTVAP